MSEDHAEKEQVAPLGVQSLRVFVIGIGILLGLAASLAAMVGFYSWKTPARDFSPPKAFPSPSVFEKQGQERIELYARQRRQLDSAGVPIAIAMAMIAERGRMAYSPLSQAQEKPSQTASAKTPNVATPRSGGGGHRKRHHGRRGYR